MKSTSLLPYLLLLFAFSTNAQMGSLEDDFEGNGTIQTWLGDNCVINPGFSNPFQNGINTSDFVLQYRDEGALYANVRFDLDNNFDLTEFLTFTLKIYVPSSGLSGNQPNQISLKLQNGTLQEPWSTQTEIVKPIILDEWQTISFDFANDEYINLDPGSLPPAQRNDLNRVLIQINGENNEDIVTAYIDDFSYDGTVLFDPVYDYLVWSDNFDDDGAINSEKWHHQTLLPPGGSWYNGEIQHYTDRIENTYVEDGKLHIVAKKETYTNQNVTKDFTSARLNSKFAFTYGRVEIRAKLPFGPGTWPALWMLGKNINEDGAYWDLEGFGTTVWPACGEIDIMEHWGTNQDYVQSAMHTPSSYGNTDNKGGITIPGVSDSFHTYAMEWSAEKIEFFYDGGKVYTYNPPIKNADTWPFDAEQYIIMNVAILPSISSSFTESAMEVDYVKVYQESPPVSTFQIEELKSAKLFPNPVQDELSIEIGKAAPENLEVFLYTVDGELVRQYEFANQSEVITINGLNGLSKGTYIISFQIDQKVEVFKFVKS